MAGRVERDGCARNDTRRQSAGAIPAATTATLSLRLGSGEPAILELRPLYERAGPLHELVAHRSGNVRRSEPADLRSADVPATHASRRLLLEGTGSTRAGASPGRSKKDAVGRSDGASTPGLERRASYLPSAS